MSGAFLRVRDLTKRFGDTLAVDSVELDVEKGNTYALLGPSGCGKTTTLRMIAGFEHADAGSIELGERTLSNQTTFLPAEKRRIGMVFQDYALFPHLTVEGNVLFGVRGHDDRRKRAQEVLEVVGLAGFGSRMPHELSGGQQQRVALARSLAVQPELVLLDEPFSNLDPAMRARVRAEIKGIIESLGITAVFVTHDQEEALSIAERVAVMLDGRIEQVGEPSEIYNQPASRRVAEFLGDANFFEGEVKEGDLAFELGSVPVSTPLSGQVSVMVRPEALSLTRDAGVEVEIERCEYFGHDQLIHVRLPSGAPAKVRTLNVGGLAPGQRAGLELRGDVVVYANGG